MLKCGECTFLHEPPEGTVGTCKHPEKYTPSKKYFKSHTLGEYLEDLNARKYDDDCRYGYPDIWAARGAAKLVRVQTPEPPKNSLVNFISAASMAGLLGAVAGYYLKKKI